MTQAESGCDEDAVVILAVELDYQTRYMHGMTDEVR